MKGIVFNTDILIASIVISIVLFSVVRSQIYSESTIQPDLYVSKYANDVLIVLEKNGVLQTLNRSVIADALDKVLTPNLAAKILITTHRCANQACDSFAENYTISVDRCQSTRPVDVMLLIDRSGSMDDDCPGGQADPGESPCKINDAKAAAKTFLDQLNFFPSDIVAFEDNFESGFAKWTESNEFDWNNETPAERNIPGYAASNIVAHADACTSATGCILTTANPIDLSIYDTVTLTFWRYVDNDLDDGEFLRVEAFNGISWNMIFSWTNGQGDDDTWRLQSYDLENYRANNFQLRFISKESSTSEETEIDDVKISASYNSPSFSDNDRTGLVSFSSTATLDQNLTFDKFLLKNKVDSLIASGSTNIGDSIYTATAELRNNGRLDAGRVEILLTDGRPNEPNSDSYALSYTINASKNASFYEIPIYAIGLGFDVNATLLQQVANITGGKYYFSPDGTQLEGIYIEIAKEILTIEPEPPRAKTIFLTYEGGSVKYYSIADLVVCLR